MYGHRPSHRRAILSRHMHKSTQLPVRISLLILAALIWMAGKFGFESILGAFAAGMILGQATRGDAGRLLREKLETVSFAWLYPFFFVGTGIKFDISALVVEKIIVNPY
jgi:Kef-type K+ transport system membrane component KefB